MEASPSPRRRFATTQVVESPKEKPEQVTLRTIYAPILAYVVLFQRAPEKNAISAERLRQEIRSQLDRAGQLATLAGYPQDKLEHVRFSIVAFVDEVLLNSEWAHRTAWMERPMQLEEFQTAIAGDQFFERLDRGGEIDPEVAEIDFIILSLGFKGRYISDEAELTAVRRRLFKRFPPQAVLSIPHLTPEAYETRAEGIEEVGDRWRVWKWVAVAGVAAVALVVYGLLQWWMGGHVEAVRQALKP
jgi:type VI secretion system protein ImpK